MQFQMDLLKLILKMSACYICSIYSNGLQTTFSMNSINVNPYQAALLLRDQSDLVRSVLADEGADENCWKGWKRLATPDIQK